MNFAQFLLVLKARYKIILMVFSITVISTFTVNKLLPKTYTATTALVLNYKGMDPVTGLTLPAQLMPGYMATQIDIITSRNVAMKAVDELKFVENPSAQAQFEQATKGKGDIHAWFADLLLKNLDVKPSRESSVIEISFKASDPDFAAVVANAFANAYQQATIQFKVESAQKAGNFLGDRGKILRAKLEKAEANLSKYQQEKGLTNVMGNLDVESARLNELSAQMVAAQSQSIEASSRQQRTRSNTDESPDIAANPVVQNLKIEISRAESKLSELTQRVGQNHPQYQAALAELEKLKMQMQDETRKATSSIGGTAQIHQQREAELRAALAAQKKKVLELNLGRDELSVLQRDVENAQREFDAASQRLSQTALESNADQTDVAVLNPAVAPIAPSGPRVVLNTILSVFLGTLLGIGSGLFAETLDRRVRSRDDITEYLDVPVFALINGTSVSKRGKRFPGLPRKLFKLA